MSDDNLRQTIEALQQQLDKLRQQAVENPEQLTKTLPATLQAMQDQLESIRLHKSPTGKIGEGTQPGPGKTGETLRQRESPDFFFEDQPQQFCHHIADGTITFANDAFCRYFDRTQYPTLDRQDRS